MKITAVSLFLVIFLLSASSASATTITNNVRVNANGSNANANVNISNNINSSSNYSSSSESRTSVSISQTGEGESSVTVNGKEWKVEGLGEIKVNENNTSTIKTSLTVLPTTEPTATLESLSNAEVEIEEDGQVLGAQTENIQQNISFIEKLTGFMSKLFYKFTLLLNS